MVLVYRGFKSDYPWPNDLVWNGLSAKLDCSSRGSSTSGRQSRRARSSRSSTASRLSSTTSSPGSTSSILWLTWLGRSGGRHAGRAPVRRRRAAAIARGAFASFAAARPLGGEHGDAGADARGGRPVAPRRHPDRDRRGPLGPVPRGDLARARRDADRAGVRLPDAGGDPVLDRPGGRGRLDDGLRDPAGRADHGARHPRRRDEHRRGRRLDGRDAAPDAVEGAAPARTPDAAARRQPDDPLRALDGRHRRPDRRRRPRRGRHERHLHEPGARDPRRHRDRDHGDGARPLDRGDRRRAPTRRSGTSTTRHARGCGASRSAASASAPRSSPRRSSSACRRSIPTRRPGQDGEPPGVAPDPDPERARLRAEPRFVGVPHHGADRELGCSRRRCCRCRAS